MIIWLIVLAVWLSVGYYCAGVYYRDMEQYKLPFDSLDKLFGIFLTIIGPWALITTFANCVASNGPFFNPLLTWPVAKNNKTFP